MPSELPYMMQMGNIPRIFERIREAGTPPKFTHEFLKNNLGFTGSGDRGIIKVLKAMGFLTADSVPTDRYNSFRGGSGPSAEVADGLREGWAPIFLSDQGANERTATQLMQLFKSATGAGDAVATKMAGTFKAVADLGDWAVTKAPAAATPKPTADDATLAAPKGTSADVPRGDLGSLILRHDIHLHLPATSDVSVYTAIFRAIRDELSD